MKYLFVFLAFIPIFSFSQVSYEHRVEIELKNDYINEKVIDFGADGMILRSKSDDTKDGKDTWRFEKYNTELEKVSSKSIKLDKAFFIDESYNTDDYYFVLFKEKKEDFVLASLNVKTMEMSKVKGVFPSKARIRGMTILGDYAFFKAYLKKHPFLLSVNWRTGKKNLIPIEIPGYSRKKTNVWNFSGS